MDGQIQRLRVDLGTLQSYEGALPLDQIKRHIRQHNIPARGIGNAKVVTLTPANLYLFFRESYVDGFAKEKFGISDLSQFQAETGLEQLIFSAQRKPIYHKGELSLDNLDLDGGVYLKPDQFASVLSEYDQNTFESFALEAGIPTTTIRGQANQTWYLLDNTTLDSLPQLTLSAVEQSLEIFDHKRIQRVVNRISRETLDLEKGVWLVAGQAAQLLENYTAHYFSNQARPLGIKREKVFGTERYFLKEPDLERFPKKQLTEGDLQVVRRLANIVKHGFVATMFECSAAYVANIAGPQQREGKVQSKKIFDDERFEQALYCYFDFPRGPTRGIIYEHVFLPLARLMGRTSIKEMQSFVSPFYLLHRRVKGIRLQQENEIKSVLRYCVTCYALHQIMDYAATHRELPVIVVNDTTLPGRGQKWTITNYFYMTAMQYFRQRFQDGLSPDILHYQEGLTGLSNDEQAYLSQRYGLNKSPQEVDWAQPTQEVMAVVLGSSGNEISAYELSIHGRLRQPDFHSFFDGFGFRVYAYLQGLKGEFSLPEKPGIFIDS